VSERFAPAAAAEPEAPAEEVAVIGMAGRFPGAADPAELWRNLRAGVESITVFGDAELLAAGVDPALLADPRYVKARGVLAGIELFDAAFFGMSPREAAITDPQQRIFLECAWEALEQAGIDAATCPERIGVYGGSALSSYMLAQLVALGPARQDEIWQLLLANDKDTLASRVSYKLNLRGPSVVVQTACSTSLVAVHLARQGLLDYECDVALAGGVSIRTPQTIGHLYQEEGIFSPDGHCRPFDAGAQGTVFSNGAGVVVLKRLSEALAGGDGVRAVIKGSAINNDGAVKAGFTAPGLEGQAEVVARALALAGVHPETVGYVEAHGTGTPLGDPIEVAALTRAFRAGTGKRGFCALGSVKGNIGHLDSAAGVAGLIKTVLALERRELPASLHFARPNPALDLEASPFYVNDRLRPWEAGATPRRAGVSSLGVGGTNAHVVLEEAPPAPAAAAGRPWQLLVLSAMTESALASAGARLSEHLDRRPDQELADVAFTLAAGRQALPCRQALVAGGREDALAALAGGDRLLRGRRLAGTPAVAFLFPGHGSQRAGMGRELYRAEPRFRHEVDRAAEILRPHLGEDLRQLLFAAGPGEPEAARWLGRTAFVQPALVTVEIAMARLWMSWGVRPQAMLGQSLGEYTAAHLAGVLSLADTLALVAARGLLLEQLSGGAMLALPLGEAEVAPLLGAELSLASVNGPFQCVVAGPEPAIAELAAELGRRGVEGRRLASAVALHSRQLDAAIEPFLRRVRQAALAPPQVPYLSSVTGRWATPKEVTEPGYWAEHLRRTVRLSDGISCLLAEPDRVLLEVGPGHTLTRLVRRHCELRGERERVVVTSLPGGAAGRPAAAGRAPEEPEPAALLAALGRLWVAGVAVDWSGFHAGENRRRVTLPTYPFERRRHWADAVGPAAAAGGAAAFPPAAEPATTPDAGPAASPRPGAGPPPAEPAEPAGGADDPLWRRLAATWREVLGVREVRRADHFFDLGGDSLTALQVVARLRAAFAVELPLRLLLEQPTAGGWRDALAAALACSQPSAEQAPAIAARGGAGPAPLSSAQQRLWFLYQLAPDSRAYLLHALVRLSGRLDRAALAGAFAEIARRHHVLRTVFRQESGGPVQVVLPGAALALPRVDLSALPTARRRAELAVRAGDAAGRPFDLERVPPVRAMLLELEGGDHYLLMVLHHIVWDAWSVAVLVRELAALYDAAVRRSPSPLAPLPLQYADFATWQQERLAAGAYQPDLAWWRQQLQGAATALELPADHPRPARESWRGAQRPVALDPGATRALTELARGREATLFMALLAVLQTLLLRYTGDPDLVVGTAVAGRRGRELEGLIGLFINTLVLRADLAGDPSFGELLDRVRRAALDAYAHQDLPFERLVEALQPARERGRNPLFQVMLVLQNTPPAELALSGLTLRAEELAGDEAMFDLALSLTERDGVVSGRLDYRSELFEAATAERLLGHFGSLLAGAAAAPGSRLSQLPLLTEAERRQLLAWNDRAAPVRRDATLRQRFAAWARATPDAAAVVAGGAVLTYGELARRARRLARRLRRLGVGPEVPVGLWAGRSPALVEGMLGILEAGGAYLPCDDTYPRERLAMMLEDAGAPVLVIAGTPAGAEERAALAGDLLARGAAVVDLAADQAALAREGDGALAPEGGGATPEGLAYVIYTSGSTGRPKGVACTHLGAVNLLADLERRWPLGPGEACSLWTSVSFDVSVWEVFAALCHGGVLAIPGAAERTSAELLFPWLARHQVRSAYLPPFLLADLAAWLGAGGPERRSLARLLVGVEPIRERLLQDLLAALPGLVIVNGYGPTEATVCATFHDVGAGAAGERRTPIGLPVANCRVHLLDGGLEEVPVGVPGELWIAGLGLARGYLGRPELTAERFVPDPFAGRPGLDAPPGGRCYRSGDLARRLAGGEIEFLGRRDQQVKLRGWRIEPGEIEATLGLHPEVRQAAVAVRRDPRGEAQLVAWVVPRGDSADAHGWRRFLAGRLPAPMVPARFVTLAALPLTPSAKLDRRALPAPDWDLDLPPDGADAAPRGPLEALLAGVWCELLGRRRVSPADDFFALGGHSLLALRMVSRARELCGVELPVNALFEARTLAGLAEQVAARLAAGTPAAAPPLVPQPRDGPLPLSFAQQRLWFFAQLEPGSPVYNVPSAVRLRGDLRPRLLRHALGEVVRRHEILRTSFPAAAGEPAQAIAPARPAALPVVDLAALPGGAREAESRRLGTALGRLPFELAQGPLLRCVLLRHGPSEHVVLLTFHHIVADAWSLGIFLREITAAYTAGMAGAAAALPELPLQYADFALWQRRWLAGEVLDGQLAWWRRQLAGMPRVLALPADRPRPAAQSFRGSSLPVVLPPALVAPLAAWGRRQGLTLFMSLLAAFAALLGRASGEDDLPVGAPISGRDRRELEDLVGLFLNTLVLRLDLAGDPGYDLLCERVRAVTLGAFAHQALPFERLVDELVRARDPGLPPLVQVGFVLLNEAPEARLPGLVVEPVPATSGTAKVDLVLTLAEAGGGLAGSWELATDLFDNATIARLSGQLAALLAGVAAEPGRRLSRLPLLGEAERHQLAVEWNDTAAAPAAAAGLDRLFAAAAARWPDRIALVAEPACLSYRQVAERAGRLAAHLRRRGVGPEVVVGICAEEGSERIVGLLAVLLAGGAYLPLDPALPAERLGFMLADAGVRLLLTQERLRAALPRHDAETLCLDRPLPAPPAGPAAGPRGRGRAGAAGSDHLAYVIYTSGSTGRPNGVLVPHRSAVHLVRHALALTDAGPATRMQQLASFGFDISVWETWTAFAAGGTLCIVDQETRQSGAALAAAIRRQAITVLGMPPGLLAGLPDLGLPSVRKVLVGGDRCSAELVRRVTGAGLPLFNCYGPTETTIYASVLRCQDDGRRARRDPSIGRPIAGVELRVVDRRGELAPIGVPGELWIAGAGPARGYLNRPALTAERFIPDPFSRQPGARLYRSGDLVRLLASGEIEFLGRIDRQVKLRGLRIELGEIEAALAEDPAVRDCVVAVREDAPGEAQLVAYLVARAGSVPDEGRMRRSLAARLPSYMVPAVFVPLPALPLSANGKVDRAALPAPAIALPARDTVAPRTAAEAALAQIWARVLGVERVGADDNFFALGGDSVLAVQVVARARQAGFRVTVRELFAHQTVAELAAVAAAAPGWASGEDETGGEVPLLPIQRWFFAGDLACPQHFNQALLLDLRTAVDPGLLARALAAVAAHHTALRYRYRRAGGSATAGGDGWRQVVAEPSLGLARLTLAVPAGRRRGVLEAAAAQVQASLDLDRGPLARAALFSADGDAQKLLLVCHHLVVDAVSWRILLDDLEEAYRCLVAGAPVALSPVGASFRAWSARLAEHARGAAVAAEADYWLDPRRCAVRPLPLDRPGGANTVASAREVVVELTSEETAELLRLPPPHTARTTDVLLAALAEAFAGWTGEARLLVDLEGHGREELFDDLDTSRTVGWFTVFFPLLLELDPGADGPGERLRGVREQRAAVPRGGIGYGLLRYLAPEDSAARLRAMPAAEVAFNFLGQVDRGAAASTLFALAAESAGPARSPRQHRGHLLEINGAVAGGRLRLGWTYSENLHLRPTVEALAGRFAAALRRLVEHCHAAAGQELTPAAFPQARISARDLDALMAQIASRVERGARDETR
jgi:amino acid adenylation domain-containing protein/non-ribosomal peptide synthase protein (TIGR01720 family)